jgi:hypothetical protein
MCFFPNKYKYKTAPGSTIEYSMILRLAEQYLIRAEARVQQNKLSDAIADLNTIRSRAGLGSIDVNSTKDQILTAILHERQVELFTEAQRWFDLKRFGLIDSVMTVVTPQKGGSKWDTNQQYYPIPLTDIQNDNNIVQNQGY